MWPGKITSCSPRRSACLCRRKRFGALAAQILPGIYGYHPDFAKIDWSQVQWFKSGKPFQPDSAKTLAENGIGHKDLIRFRTPGLTGISGS